MSQIEFRQAIASDLPFIFRSWLKTYKNSSFAKDIESKTYFEVHHKIIEVLMKRSVVLIAHPVANPDSIAGFLVYEKASTPIIHYVYVRFSMQKFGVATELLKYADLDLSKQVIQYTHQEVRPMWVKLKYPTTLKYNPYAI